MDTGLLARGDALDAAAYMMSEVAALIGVPVSTLQKWTAAGPRESAPIIVTPDPRFLSFTNIVESYVLASLRKQRISLKGIRIAVHFVERYFERKHALAHQEFMNDGIDLFLTQLDGLVKTCNDGHPVLQEYLKRVDYAHGRAVRLFPLFREHAPRTIVVDPQRAFGRPVLFGTSVPIVDINARFQRGDGVDQLASDYEVTRAEIEEALRATHIAA